MYRGIERRKGARQEERMVTNVMEVEKECVIDW